MCLSALIDETTTSYHIEPLVSRLLYTTYLYLSAHTEETTTSCYDIDLCTTYLHLSVHTEEITTVCNDVDLCITYLYLSAHAEETTTSLTVTCRIIHIL